MKNLLFSPLKARNSDNNKRTIGNRRIREITLKGAIGKCKTLQSQYSENINLIALKLFCFLKLQYYFCYFVYNNLILWVDKLNVCIYLYVIHYLIHFMSFHIFSKKRPFKDF